MTTMGCTVSLVSCGTAATSGTSSPVQPKSQQVEHDWQCVLSICRRPVRAAVGKTAARAARHTKEGELQVLRYGTAAALARARTKVRAARGVHSGGHHPAAAVHAAKAPEAGDRQSQHDGHCTGRVCREWKPLLCPMEAAAACRVPGQTAPSARAHRQ